MNFFKALLKSSTYSVLNSILNVTQVLILYKISDASSINLYLVYISLFLTADLVCSYQLNSYIAREVNLLNDELLRCSKFEMFNFLLMTPFLLIGLLATESSYSLLFLLFIFLFRNIYSINGLLRRKNAEHIYYMVLAFSSALKLLTIILDFEIEIILFLFSLFEVVTVIILNLVVKFKFKINLFLFPKFDFILFKNVLRLNLQQYGNLPFNQLDVIVLNLFFTELEVNSYKFARRIVGFAGRIVNPMNNILLNGMIKNKINPQSVFTYSFISCLSVFSILILSINISVSEFNIDFIKNVSFNSILLTVAVAEALLLACSTMYTLVLFKKLDSGYMFVVLMANSVLLIAGFHYFNIAELFGIYVSIIFIFSSFLYARK